MKNFPAEGRFKPLGFDLVSQSEGLAVLLYVLKPRLVGGVIHFLRNKSNHFSLQLNPVCRSPNTFLTSMPRKRYFLNIEQTSRNQYINISFNSASIAMQTMC